jgi:TRAP-type mannitol/chloroaromatic compound transport system substrate-binding protein
VVWSMAVVPAAQPPVINEFRAKGIEVRRFPAPVLAALRKASNEVLQEEAKNDPLFKEALDSLNAYTKLANQWLTLQALPTE